MAGAPAERSSDGGIEPIGRVSGAVSGVELDELAVVIVELPGEDRGQVVEKPLQSLDDLEVLGDIEDRSSDLVLATLQRVQEAERVPMICS